MTLVHSLDAFGLRRIGALYLLAFFLCVAVAPHRHANSIEDLLSDERSDSGVFLESDPRQDPSVDPQWGAARLIDDDPCLACFHHDYDSATEVIAIFTLDPGFRPVSPAMPPADPAIPATHPESSRSRAPPPLA